MFKLIFDIENEAFKNDKKDVISYVLIKVWYQIEKGKTSGSVLDANGNKIGGWSMKRLQAWYFTFGSDEEYPYHRGQYVKVYAYSKSEAIKKYNQKHPMRNGKFINCAFYYSQEEWDKQLCSKYETKCVEVIE